jgi:A/G-specific adenine glycosylase
LAWYDRQRRDLPWRRHCDPYHVWLSEIMLQQTRVAAVVEYYERFLRRFPTVKKLAAARQSSVLAAWSGLGYYRRARMLHQAARQVVKGPGGKFPASAEELQKLPGIGRYTAAAIASIAFGEPVAVVDGNVGRVLQRVLGKRLDGEARWRSAEGLLSRQRPGDFNQAMMELGATVCLPRQPMCRACPVFDFCATRGELEKPAKEVRRKRRIQYALDCRDGKVLMVMRPKTASLMPGMWELPETTKAMKHNSLSFRHSITVTDYLVRVSRSGAPEGTVGRWVRRTRLAHLPLTGLARKILRTAEVI